MPSWEYLDEKEEELEKRKRSLEETAKDKEIGIVGQIEVQKEIDEINKKLGRGR